MMMMILIFVFCQEKDKGGIRVVFNELVLRSGFSNPPPPPSLPLKKKERKKVNTDISLRRYPLI